MKDITGKFLYVLLTLIILLDLQTGCERDPGPEPEPKDNLTPLIAWQIMDEYYLWNETMPVIDPANYDTPEAILEALRDTTYDRFSYIEETEAFNQYYQEGKYIGHGLSLKYDEDGKLRVAFVYDQAPADQAGVERGWTVLSINGTTIAPFSDYTGLLGGDQVGTVNTFLFNNLLQEHIELSISKEEVNINSVLHKEIFDINGIKAAYLVFNHFIEPAMEELDQAFSEFSENGVDELILDLRYNRGGVESVYTYLAGLIGGTITNNQVITKYIHNTKQTARNKEIKAASYVNSISVDRVIFITTRSTASASELVINGLKPYLDVKSFGDNTTGKPVGMYAWPFDDYTFVPICFKFVNANDEGDFYEGLVPDVYVADDLTVPFGDPEEDCLKAALHYLGTGVLAVPGTRKAAIMRVPEYLPKGVRSEIGAL